ncbi:radical SAM protein, partial [Brachyspira pulli]
NNIIIDKKYLELEERTITLENTNKLLEERTITLENTNKLLEEKYNYLNSVCSNIINTIAWWIPVKKWRDNFRNKIQSRAEQSRAEQSRAEQSRAEQ